MLLNPEPTAHGQYGPRRKLPSPPTRFRRRVGENVPDGGELFITQLSELEVAVYGQEKLGVGVFDRLVSLTTELHLEGPRANGPCVEVLAIAKEVAEEASQEVDKIYKLLFGSAEHGCLKDRARRVRQQLSPIPPNKRSSLVDDIKAAIKAFG